MDGLGMELGGVRRWNWMDNGKGQEVEHNGLEELEMDRELAG